MGNASNFPFNAARKNCAPSGGGDEGEREAGGNASKTEQLIESDIKTRATLLLIDVNYEFRRKENFPRAVCVCV